jgi:hypothetical protein
VQRVRTLTLASYVFEDEACGNRAAEQLRYWFLDRKAGMRPHLRHAQMIPGRNDGSRSGIIEAMPFKWLIDSIILLKKRGHWSDKDDKTFRRWLTRYLEWLLRSKFGKKEGARTNNHGTWYAVQVLCYSLYLRPSDASRIAVDGRDRLLLHQIAPDGTQPEEMERTRTFHYHTYNLLGLFQLALMAEALNLNFWDLSNLPGQRLKAALDLVAPYALGDKEWAYPETRGELRTLIPLLTQGYRAWRDATYLHALSALVEKDDVDADFEELRYYTEAL